MTGGATGAGEAATGGATGAGETATGPGETATGGGATGDQARYCPSRRGGRHCTRPLGHPGLHRNEGALWSDASADPPRCPASGEPAQPAAELADGFPHGRAACPHCQRFIELDGEGRLTEHDTTDPAESSTEIASRREWFNTHGW